MITHLAMSSGRPATSHLSSVHSVLCFARWRKIRQESPSLRSAQDWQPPTCVQVHHAQLINVSVHNSTGTQVKFKNCCRTFPRPQLRRVNCDYDERFDIVTSTVRSRHRKRRTSAPLSAPGGAHKMVCACDRTSRMPRVLASEDDINSMEVQRCGCKTSQRGARQRSPRDGRTVDHGRARAAQGAAA